MVQLCPCPLTPVLWVILTALLRCSWCTIKCTCLKCAIWKVLTHGCRCEIITTIQTIKYPSPPRVLLFLSIPPTIPTSAPIPSQSFCFLSLWTSLHFLAFVMNGIISYTLLSRLPSFTQLNYFEHGGRSAQWNKWAFAPGSMLLCHPGGSLHPLPLPSLVLPHDPSLCPLGDLVEKTPCTWNSSRVCECRPGMVCVTSATNSCARCVACPIFPPGMVTKRQREQSTPPTKGQKSVPLQLCLSPPPTGQMTFNPSC